MKYPLLITAALFSLGVHAKSLNDLELMLEKESIDVYSRINSETFSQLNFEIYLTSDGVLFYDEVKKVLLVGDDPRRLGDGGKFYSVSSDIYQSLLSKYPAKVIAKAPNEKKVIYMITDTACGWCKRAHSELDQYLEAGITVEFLLYSGAGKGSYSFDAMASVLASDSPLKALSDAFDDVPVVVTSNVDQLDHIGEAGKFGKMLGINGTPMFFIDGVRVDGYVPVARVLEGLATDGRR